VAKTPRRGRRPRNAPRRSSGTRSVELFERARAFAIENPDEPFDAIARRFGYSPGALWQAFKDDGVVEIRNAMRRAMVEEAALALARRLGDRAGEQIADLASSIAETRRGLLARILAASVGDEGARLVESEVSSDGTAPASERGMQPVVVRKSARYRAPHHDSRLVEMLLKTELHVLEVMAGIRRATGIEDRVRTAIASVEAAPTVIPTTAGGGSDDEAVVARSAAIETFGIIPGPGGVSIVAPPSGPSP
jgi:AcrR family transcriptional regulator